MSMTRNLQTNDKKNERKNKLLLTSKQEERYLRKGERQVKCRHHNYFVWNPTPFSFFSFENLRFCIKTIKKKMSKAKKKETTV